MSDQFEREILERVERLEELGGAIADMVVGLTREQYAQNVLSIEQESLGADFLKGINEKLLDSMANIMALNALVKGERRTLGMAKADLVDGLKRTLKRSVDEYLMGLRIATEGG